MSLFGEFQVSAEVFVLHRALTECPDAVVEFERVVVDEDRLAPYLWVGTDDQQAFERAATEDPSVADLERLESFDEDSLYRATWNDGASTLVDLLARIDAVVLEASGRGAHWELRIRFDDRDQVSRFQKRCLDRDVTFTVSRLYGPSQSLTGGQYGLTEKQQEALVTAWECGYFDSPREATLEDVADRLGITRQSLSQRLRRAHRAMVENTLIVSPPAGDGSESN